MMERVYGTWDEIGELFASGGDVLDRENGIVYISDISGEEEKLFGVMYCDVPEEARSNANDAAEWALGHVPAPGSGAGNRMGFISRDDWGWGGGFYDLAEEMIDHPERFDVCAH